MRALSDTRLSNHSIISSSSKPRPPLARAHAEFAGSTHVIGGAHRRIDARQAI